MPLRSSAEIRLFKELLPRFTSAARSIDYTGMAIEYNAIAGHSMRAALSESRVPVEGVILLTNEGHLRNFAKSALATVAGRQAQCLSSMARGMHSVHASANVLSGPQLFPAVQGGHSSVPNTVQSGAPNSASGNAFAMLMSQPEQGGHVKKRGRGLGGAQGCALSAVRRPGQNFLVNHKSTRYPRLGIRAAYTWPALDAWKKMWSMSGGLRRQN